MQDTQFALFVLQKQVKSIQETQTQTLDSSEAELDNLLKSVKNTHGKYKDYLTSMNNGNNNNNDKYPKSIANKHKMTKQVSKCEEEFNKILSNNMKIISRNSSTILLRYKKNEIRKAIENEFITVETLKMIY